MHLRTGGKQVSNQTDGMLQTLESCRPFISKMKVDETILRSICPVSAIGVNPVRIDLVRCNGCRECSKQLPTKFSWTTDDHLISNVRDRLIVFEEEQQSISIDRNIVRSSIKVLKDTQISLYFLGDVHVSMMFKPLDFKSHNIKLVDDAADAQVLVITSAVADEQELYTQFHALQDPKMVILFGSQAIRGFEDMNELFSTNVNERINIDLFIGGYSLDPLQLVMGIESLLNSKY